MSEWVAIGMFTLGLLLGTVGTGLMFAIELNFGKGSKEVI